LAAKSAVAREASSLEGQAQEHAGKAKELDFSLGASSRSAQAANVVPGKVLSNSQGLGSGASVAEAVQEIVARMPSALRGSNLDARGNLSMDFSVDGLGQLKLSIERSGERISVNLQTSSDSSKEQLAGQRQELEREIRNLGYSDVNVDIGSQGDQAREDWRRRGTGSSNAESAENVKLAGNAKADLSEILAMK
jgi:hypothetical protein